MAYDSAAIATILRMQAWERAKGELESMLHTYYDTGEAYDAIAPKIATFIKDIEDNL